MYLESLAILPATSQTQVGRCREGHVVGRAVEESALHGVFFSSSDHKDRFTAIWKESIATEPFIS